MEVIKRVSYIYTQKATEKEPLKLNTMTTELNINQRINCNATENLAFIFSFPKQLPGTGRTPVEFVNCYRANVYKLGQLDTWVRASKKMKQELRLIGVGKYLKNEKA